MPDQDTAAGSLAAAQRAGGKKESLEATAVREVREETGLEGCSEGLIDTT